MDALCNRLHTTMDQHKGHGERITGIMNDILTGKYALIIGFEFPFK